ncbi:SpoIIE family protein phosphatase [Limnobacter sp.]|uniref:SpoIIE family protein phosphatase n=1 Tax=Limnobacter sp. TaxID=2003368 RepID=UPI0035110B07
MGESACGDQVAHWHFPGGMLLALADGLGHGPQAQDAAALAMHTLGKQVGSLQANKTLANCSDLFSLCDKTLEGSRGAAMALGLLDHAQSTVELASVGNVRIRVLRQQQRDLSVAASRGIVGAGYQTLTPETIRLHDGDLVVLFSDGMDELANIREFLNPQATPAEMQRSVHSLVSAFGKHNDDVAVLVYRHGSTLPEPAHA